MTTQTTLQTGERYRLSTSLDEKPRKYAYFGLEGEENLFFRPDNRMHIIQVLYVMPCGINVDNKDVMINGNAGDTWYIDGVYQGIDKEYAELEELWRNRK